MTTELMEARAVRGLPPYRAERIERKPLSPPPPRGNTLRFCRWCKEEFPATEFTSAGNSYADPPCNDCFKQRYGKVNRYVCACGTAFESRKRDPRCNPCRWQEQKRRAAA